MVYITRKCKGKYKITQHYQIELRIRAWLQAKNIGCQYRICHSQVIFLQSNQ